MAKYKISLPESFSYYDKYLQREVRLQPKPDEIVVTVDPITPGQTPAANKSLVNKASNKESMDGLLKANYSRGIAVMKVAPATESINVARAQPDDELLNSIPAFVDSEGLTRYFVPDEITVQFKPEVRPEQAEQIIQEQGSSIVVKQRTPGYYTIAVPEGSDPFSAIAKFNQLESVQFAETSEVGIDDALEDPPDDEAFPNLWGLHNTGQVMDGASGKPGADIRALEAWEMTRGSEDVVIVVIDTGMDLTHDDLAGNLLPRGTEDWDFADDGDGSPDDSGSHGTHVCGIAAALRNNAVGVSGVAPECKLMPLRINLSAGMNANRADAINFAADKAARNPDKRYVINCSWKCSGAFSAILLAIDNAVAKGALVVVAAGNGASDMDIDPPTYPGVHPTAICVASLTSKDTRSGSSNVGSQITVSAPGQTIFSTMAGNTYGFETGTSMAAPHVAGTIALIWSANPTLSNLQVRDLLESTCDDIAADNPALVGKLGRGRINAARAVQAAIGVTV